MCLRSCNCLFTTLFASTVSPPLWSLITDRYFTSHFWTALIKLLGLQRRLSTAFHPQTDGQNERANQILEQYLRIYCSYQQDDWYNYLSLAEFAINNAHQSSLKCSPFFANYGYNSMFSIDIAKSSLSVPAANDLAARLSDLHEDLKENLVRAQNPQAKYYDAKQTDAVCCWRYGMVALD
jgi:hypothetical protein